MAPLVCVVGATGGQGGSVCRALIASGKYKVRGITRKPDSDSAKKLASSGVEIVAADVNDEASLAHAFAGATAIFAVTAYWESVMTLGRDGAGEEEVEQQKKMARAAASTPTLKHYVLSSLPPCDKMSGGRFKVPHFDYKEVALDWMKEGVPELVAKTTFFWPGFYASNLAYFPVLKMIPVPISGTYLLPLPCKTSSICPSGGNVQHNTGIVVEAILNMGERAHGRIVVMVTDYITYDDVVKIWGKVTGKTGFPVEVPASVYGGMWGPFGDEMASQLLWGEEYEDWDKPAGNKLLTLEELGVQDKIQGFEEGLTAVKSLLT